MSEVEILEKILENIEEIKVYVIDIHALIFFLLSVGFALLIVYMTCKPLFWFLHEY